ncbi:MAG: (2Fe-2S)-binding protein [bacterium]
MIRSKNKNDEPGHHKGISRRSFLKGVGLTSVGVATATGTGLLVKLRKSGILPAEGKILGPEAVPIVLRVNGKATTVKVEPRMTLADVLREHLHLTGTKVGCDRGACGACTVLLDGKNVASCMTLAVDAAGLPVETIEGLSPSDGNGTLHAIQESFIEHDALQCGFCTSGMIMSCKHLLDHNPNPTLEEVKVATSGNLCRCGTYPKVFQAVLAARAGK